MKNSIVQKDLAYIFDNFGERGKLKDSSILVTGCAGFVGFYLMQFLSRHAKKLRIKKIIGVDNFALGKPRWLKEMVEKNLRVAIYNFDIAKDNLQRIPQAREADYVIHMASIASPSFYRKYPLETIDANVWGLRHLLDFYKDKAIQGFLFFSSSEIYGDPAREAIPTKEDYRGRVATIGPRACYDQSKQFGETLAHVYAKTYEMPITIVRPFNNYGPGMRLFDKRVPADFAKALIENRDMVIFSDGTPTRTFCYIADAVTGYLKALTFGQFDYFNIGIEKPEISVRQLAEIFQAKGREVANYRGAIRFRRSPDKEYLAHNPSRRCPDIEKAKTLLGYNPSILVNEGVEKFLTFIKLTKGIL